MRERYVTVRIYVVYTVYANLSFDLKFARVDALSECQATQLLQEFLPFLGIFFCFLDHLEEVCRDESLFDVLI